jgi:hypothetical protein
MTAASRTPGVSERDFLDLIGEAARSAGDDDVLDPVGEMQVAAVEVADVTGVQPATDQGGRCGIRVVSVAEHHHVTKTSPSATSVTGSQSGPATRTAAARPAP